MKGPVTLVLPFAFEIDERGHERSLPREAEIALVFSVIEDHALTGHTPTLFEKVKRKLLKKEPEHAEIEEPPKTGNIELIMKVFCPAWIISLGNEKHVIIDGLGFLTNVLKYDELPDLKTFINEIKKPTKVDQYLEVLRKNQTVFSSFKGSRSFIMEGLLSEENLISDLQALIPHFREEEIVKAVSLNPRVSWQQADYNANILHNLIKGTEEDIEKLTSTKEILLKQSKKWLNQQEIIISKMKKDASARIEKEESNSSVNIENIQNQYKSKVTEAEIIAGEQTEKLKQEQNKLEAEILELENQEQEHVRNLNLLNSKREETKTELALIVSQRDKLTSKITDIEARINKEKTEYARLQGLAEASKGDEKDVTMRKEITRIEKKIDKLNRSVSSINQEIEKLDKEGERRQNQINELTDQINTLTHYIEKITVSKTEKKNIYMSIPLQIEDIRKRTDENLRRMSEECNLKVREEEIKAKELKTEIMKQLKIQQKIKDELTKRTEQIISQIDNLKKNKRKFLEDVDKIIISTPRESTIKDIALLQIPFYIISYETPSETIYSLLSPLATSPLPEGIPGIKEPFAQTHKTTFENILKVKLLDAIKYDTALFHEIQEGSLIVNLLQDPKTLEALFEGITKLKLSNDKAQQLKVAFSNYFHKK